MVRQAESRGRGRGVGWGLLIAALLLGGLEGLQAQTQELIVDLLTTPNRYWNKTVLLKGHVRSVAANPPGTNRGSFVLRDASDADITVITNELPAQGKEYTVTGVVEQSMPGDSVPFLRETTRRLGTETPAPKPAEAPPAVTLPAKPEAPVAVTRERAAAPPASRPEAPAARAVPAVPAAVEVVPAPSAVPPEAPLLTTRTLLIGLGALAVALAGVAVVLARSRRTTAAPPAQTTNVRRPTPAPPPPAAAPRPAADPAATRFIPPGSQQAGALLDGDATAVLVDQAAELVAVEGPDKGRRFQLAKPRMSIGRSGGRVNDVTLSDETISREHATVTFDASARRFTIVNETPVNPTKVNGNIVDAVVLRENDVIQMGRTSLRFRKSPQ